MIAMKIYARSLYRKNRYLLLPILVFALLWSFPGLLSTGSNQSGYIPGVAAAGDPVIAAAGDIACDPSNSVFNGGLGNANSCRQKYTSDLLVNLANTGLAGVLDLGDNQYYCGGYQAYLQAYDPTWGRLKSITHPSVGNHEYLISGGTDCTTSNAGAAGYFQYFGAAAGAVGQGYYSFDIGAWHLIALNSNCGDAGGCSSSSAQYKWLQADLASHSNFCTLAYWHIPLYSSGGRASSNSKSFWNLLYANNADLILTGHDHIYERFAPQDPNGNLDLVRGIPEFVVGTGGANHTSLVSIAANSIVQNTSTFGILKLTLHDTSYDWQFIPEAGKTFTDSGTASCHGIVPNTPTPTATATSNVTGTPTSTFTPTTLGNTPTASATPSVTITPSPTPVTSSVTFNPVADTYVNAGSTTSNFGSATTMRLDGSPDLHAYLRFNVSGLSGSSISQVRLLLYANNTDSSGIRAWAVADNTWGELTTNYSNAPALGSQLASSGPFATVGWVTLDVTSYITGNGTYSIGVTNLSSTAISVASRESGANAPQLIVTYFGSSGATSTPTFTPTPTFTLTPVATSTPTPTSTATPTLVATPTFTSTPTSLASPTPTTVFSPTATPTATLVFTPVSTPTPTPTLAAGSLTFTPIADTYVNSASTTSNFGSATTMRMDGSPDVHAYLRFTVSGFSGTISQVRLLLFANNTDSSGISAWAVADNTWGELTTNYTNAPALGSQLSSSGPFATVGWVTLDVTSYITGNGTYSIGVTNLSSTAISVGSRESGANAPQLVITYH